MKRITVRPPALPSTALCALVLLLLFAGLAVAAQIDPAATRSVTGTVSDGGRPVPGVQVMLQQIGTGATRSYVTDTEGHYRFTNLSSNMDYKVWARYKGHDYRRRRISKFDADPTPVKNLTLRKRRH